MTNVESIIDKFTEYASVFSTVTNKYVNMYGKDAMYLFLAKTETDDNPYVTALGKNNVSFDYASPEIKKVPVHILVDQADWYKSYLGDAVDSMLYFSTEVTDPITAGDVVVYQRQNLQYFYRVNEPNETYSKIIYKCNLKLIQTKEIKKNLKNGQVGVIF